MLFREIYSKNKSPLYADVVTRYGETIADWFYKRFKNYELLYDGETFFDLFQTMINESHLELLKVKEYFEIKKVWELGNFVESNSYMESDANSSGTQSYQGYNVEGDFSKNTTSGKQNANTLGNTKSINITDEYNKMLSFDYTRILDKIYNKFVVLFVLVI